MARIGVFLCWCGENIAHAFDMDELTEQVAAFPGVHCAVNYKYMCSDPGQATLREKIKSEGLDGVVVAACSPHMHQRTFRAAAAAAGLNPFLVEIANIREHCSWVHEPYEDETLAKALAIIRMAVAKVRQNHALEPIKVPLTKRALVIGGGVAGIQASLDIADSGYEVVLVEREPSIGGKMAGLSETFPTLDCSQCILTPRMVEVGQHPKIKLYTWSEVTGVEGFVGNFKVRIRKKARFVDTDKCNGCLECWNRCPQSEAKSEFDYGLTKRKAIYTPFPQAVPARPVIDWHTCSWFQRKECRTCENVCQPGAINFDDKDRIVTEEVGAIVVATGFRLYSIAKEQKESKYTGYGEYGYGEYPDVIDGLQFERLLSASGPTAGEVKRPSDGKVPKNVVFIGCVGSRDNAKGISYCSKICCMYTAKHAMIYKHKVHDGQAHVFYMDIRSGGKNYDEFVRRAIEKDGAKYYRGRVSKITQEDGHIVVRGADTLAGVPVTIKADLVVLAPAIRAADGALDVAQMLKISYDEFGFLSESHPKLRPVETNTAGVYICGACQAPKDIPESVAQASAAAGKVQVLFSHEQLTREPEIARINAQTCAACFTCVRTCPYGAISEDFLRDGRGNIIKPAAKVNESLCMGCGTCVSVCPSKSADLEGFSEEQVYEMVRNLV